MTDHDIVREGSTYRLTFKNHGDVPLLTCNGRISMASPAAELNPFFDSVHERLVAARASVVTVDIRQLEFLNSSGFKCFIHWAEKILALPEDRQYRMSFRGDSRHGWQRSGIPAMRVFAVHIIDYTLT